MRVCNRCMEPNYPLTPVRSADLCADCLCALDAWLNERTAPRLARKRLPWTDAITALCRREGVITPPMLAAEMGTTRERAHWQLNYHCRLGLIDRAGRTGRYCLPSKVAAE